MRNTAKLFMNGRSQAVRLPAELRFPGTEVLIEKRGEEVVLRAKPAGWGDFFAPERAVPDDFLKDRKDLPLQARDAL